LRNSPMVVSGGVSPNVPWPVKSSSHCGIMVDRFVWSVVVTEGCCHVSLKAALGPGPLGVSEPPMLKLAVSLVSTFSGPWSNTRNGGVVSKVVIFETVYQPHNPPKAWHSMKLGCTSGSVKTMYQS